MKELEDKDFDLVNKVVARTAKEFAIADYIAEQKNPFLLSLFVPITADKRKVEAAANEIFHSLGILSAERTLKMGEGDDYCCMFIIGDGDYYALLFNHPKALAFKEGDEEYQYTLKCDNERQEREAEEEEAEMRRLVADIKAGRLKSKSTDGYLVLAGEFYDAIEAGKKKVEYRDFTENILKRTIGLKTIRFNRGYGSKGKPPKQMRWEVKRVTFVDDENEECNPMKVPENFWPTTIAIHLGKRLD